MPHIAAILRVPNTARVDGGVCPLPLCGLCSADPSHQREHSYQLYAMGLCPRGYHVQQHDGATNDQRGHRHRLSMPVATLCVRGAAKRRATFDLRNRVWDPSLRACGRLPRSPRFGASAVMQTSVW